MTKHNGSDVKACRCLMCRLCKTKNKKKRYRYYARRRQRHLVKQLLHNGDYDDIPDKITGGFEA